MATKVQVSDTFDFWRQQFNHLIDETNTANSLFVTPQEFGAVGDGVVNDTAAFAAAQATGKPVYVPPGNYNITQVFGLLNPVTGEVTSNFFAFGGVTWTNGFNGLAWMKYNMDVSSSGPLFSTAKVTKLIPTSDAELTSKKYVDDATTLLQSNINSLSINLTDEISNRTASELTINQRIDTEISDRNDLKTYTDTHFFRNDVTNTASGGIFNFQTVDGFSPDVSPTLFKGLQVTQNVAGSGALMSFHVANDFAGFFGISGALNDFIVGGWSFGTGTRYRVHHEGNMGSFSAPGRKTSTGSWFNEGFLKIGTDGGVEGGSYYDFHCAGASGDFDIRISSSIYDNNRFLSFVESQSPSISSITMDITAGNISITDKVGPGSASLILRSEHLTSYDAKFGSDKSYLVCSLFDTNGGARIRGHYHNGTNSNAPAALLEGIKNDDGQTLTEWAVVSANAMGLSAPGNGIGCNINDNIFGSYNNGSARLIVKGDGRILAPNCSHQMIVDSDSDKILTTREYSVNLVNYALFSYLQSHHYNSTPFNGVAGDKDTGYVNVYSGVAMGVMGAVTFSVGAVFGGNDGSNRTFVCEVLVYRNGVLVQSDAHNARVNAWGSNYEPRDFRVNICIPVSTIDQSASANWVVKMRANLTGAGDKYATISGLVTSVHR